MKIAVDISQAEMALLQKQADEDVAHGIPSTAQDVVLRELQPASDSLIAALKEKFAAGDVKLARDAITPANVAAVKVALGI